MRCQLHWTFYFKWKIAGLKESQESKGCTQNAVALHFSSLKCKKAKRRLSRQVCTEEDFTYPRFKGLISPATAI